MSNWTKDDLFNSLRNVRRKTAGSDAPPQGAAGIRWVAIGNDILHTVNDDDGAHLVQLGYELRARQMDLLRDRIREVWLSEEQRRRATGKRRSPVIIVLEQLVQAAMTNYHIVAHLETEPLWDSIRVFDRGDYFLFESPEIDKEVKKSSVCTMASRLRKQLHEN